MNIDFKAF